jgi:hypothetical protein
MATHDLGQQWHETQLGTVDAEIARQAFLCDIRILDPGVIERVVAGDATVCGRANEQAFRKLRGLVAMHYSLSNDSINALGPEASRKLLDTIRERLRKRYDLGGEQS